MKVRFTRTIVYEGEYNITTAELRRMKAEEKDGGGSCDLRDLAYQGNVLYDEMKAVRLPPVQ